MQRLEVSGAVRLIYRSLDVKGLMDKLQATWQGPTHFEMRCGCGCGCGERNCTAASWFVVLNLPRFKLGLRWHSAYT